MWNLCDSFGCGGQLVNRAGQLLSGVQILMCFVWIITVLPLLELSAEAYGEEERMAELQWEGF